MRYAQTRPHLDATERFKVTEGDNHVSFTIYDRDHSGIGFVLGDSNGLDVNAAWLRRLAGELLNLADRTEQRERTEVPW